MGLADKAIAGAIRGIVSAVGSAEKKAAGYVGSKVLANKASGQAGRYTINAFLGKFTAAAEKDVVKNQGVGSIVPRAYMAPRDLKFVPNGDSERVFLGGRDITEHWNSGNFKPAHFGEYLPYGHTKAKYGPWYKGDWGASLSPDGIPTLKMRYDALRGNLNMQYMHRPYDFSPEEIQMGREWIATTGATGAAFWGAVSNMRRGSKPKEEQPDEEQPDETE